MEKHRCKLCFRNFGNGRALGGHLRSHMMNLYASSKAKQELIKEVHAAAEEKENINDHRQISEEFESAPTSSSSSSEEEDEEINPKKKIGMVVDQEFCFGGIEVAAADDDAVVVQDRESETESSKNPICRRSKRVRKSRISDTLQFSGYISNSMMKEAHVMKKPKSEKNGRFSCELAPFVEAEPISSISDTTPEEDVAYCLMMLSRDKWKKEDNEEDIHEEEEEEEAEACHEEQEKEKKIKDATNKYCHGFGVVKVTKSRSRGKYRCETCNKAFRSYQALGGHKASHKRIKALISNSTEEETAVVETGNAASGSAAGGSSVVAEEKIHECPFCYRVFSSGQALGGHKRSHVMGAAAAAAIHVSISPSPAAKPFSRFGDTFIDLNLPAPVDDDDISQIELSAVSDAEFVNPFKQ